MPSLSISQNYLKDSRLVARLIERSGLGPDDVVYEIGPGKGIITAQLGRRCKQVVAVEKDSRLSARLSEVFSAQPNVTIVTGDFLDYPLPRHSYKIFANIPFNITAAILTHVTGTANPPELACLAVQKEAAWMYLGKPRETLRSILLKPWFEVDLLHHFSRHDFVPEPGVDVVMLQLCKRSPPLINAADYQLYRDFVVYCFTQWQHSLACTLRKIVSRYQLKALEKALNLDLDLPPSALTFDCWLDLFAQFKAVCNTRSCLSLLGSERRLIRQQSRLQKVHRSRIALKQIA